MASPLDFVQPAQPEAPPKSVLDFVEPAKPVPAKSLLDFVQPAQPVPAAKSVLDFVQPALPAGVPPPSQPQLGAPGGRGPEPKKFNLTDIPPAKPGPGVFDRISSMLSNDPEIEAISSQPYGPKPEDLDKVFGAKPSLGKDIVGGGLTAADRYLVAPFTRGIPLALAAGSDIIGGILNSPDTTHGLKELSEFALTDASLPGLMAPGARVTPSPAAAPIDAAMATKAGDTLKQIFTPATRGPEAATTAGIIREQAAIGARDTAQVEKSLEPFQLTVARLPEEQRYQFIDDIEHGRPQANPVLQPVADAVRKPYVDTFKKIEDMGLDQKMGFIENYYTHIWKDPAKAQEVFAGYGGGKRPLEGTKYFTKERTIPTIAEGRAAGLEPLTSDPLETTMLYITQANKYLSGQAIFSEMKDRGLAQFVRVGEKPPPGFVKIDDRIAQVHRPIMEEGAKEGARPAMVKIGEYYAPQPAAMVLNNYLSPGITGPWRGVYDLWRKAGNFQNMAQLGMSAYHLTFTSLDSMASGVALGARQIARGEPLRGAYQMARSLSPTRPIESYLTGRKAWQTYLKPEGGNPALAPLIDAYVRGGGRVAMDKFYRGTAAGSFWNSLRVGGPELAGRQIADTFKALGPVKGAANFLGRTMETIAAPLMEDIVPKQKLGVALEMLRDELRRNPGMTLDEQRAAFGKITDSVDNRMGQLVYDNLFWNKVQKQLLMASVRAVGWNLGTIREVGGGLMDLPKLLTKGEMTQKASYVIGAMTVLGLYGSIYQYLKTGKAPENVADMYMPRTGGQDQQGNPERIIMPSYLKDVLDTYQAPFDTIRGKANPLINDIQEMITNRNFYGAMVVNGDDPLVKQLQDGATELSQQFVPFGVRNITGFGGLPQSPDTKISPYEMVFGLNPVPRRINPEVEPHMTAEQKHALFLKILRESQQ